MNLNIPGMASRPASTFNHSHTEQTHVSVNKSEKAPQEKSLIEQINEKGFGSYMDELQARKKEELRKKILGEMGLSEELLSKMSPKQRAAVEKIVNAEMNKRMTAEAELDQQNKNALSMHTNPTQQNQMTATAKIDSSGVGIGPLLALQEINQQTTVTDGKKDQVTG